MWREDTTGGAGDVEYDRIYLLFVRVVSHFFLSSDPNTSRISSRPTCELMVRAADLPTARTTVSLRPELPPPNGNKPPRTLPHEPAT